MNDEIKKVKDIRKREKIIAIKSGLAIAGCDLKQIAETAGDKIFFTSLIGVGALCAAGGIATQEPTKIAAGVGAAGFLTMISVSYLKEMNGFIGVKEQIAHLASDINETYNRVAAVDIRHPLPTEEKGRQL